MPSTTRDLALDMPSGQRTDAHGHATQHIVHDEGGARVMARAAASPAMTGRDCIRTLPELSVTRSIR
ncbi:hypothetical protein CKW47_20050 [Bordetella pertussis]|nr:hypothetical protein CKW47_20050 [Bordetella pertussis]